MPVDKSGPPADVLDQIRQELADVTKRVRDLENNTVMTVQQSDLVDIEDPLEGETVIDHTDDQFAWYSNGVWHKAALSAATDIYFASQTHDIASASLAADTYLQPDFTGEGLYKRDLGETSPASASSPYSGTYFEWNESDHEFGFVIKDGVYYVECRWQFENAISGVDDLFELELDNVGMEFGSGATVLAGAVQDGRFYRRIPVADGVFYTVKSQTIWVIPTYLKLGLRIKHTHTPGIGASDVTLQAVRIGKDFPV